MSLLVRALFGSPAVIGAADDVVEVVVSRPLGRGDADHRAGRVGPTGGGGGGEVLVVGGFLRAGAIDGLAVLIHLAPHARPERDVRGGTHGVASGKSNNGDGRAVSGVGVGDADAGSVRRRRRTC